MNPVLELRGVSFSYKGAERPSLKDVDLAIGRKERTVIMGANGAGKSTLFHHLNGILKPDRGAVLFDGEHVSYRRKGLRALRSKVSLVMQNPDDQIFGQTVEADASNGPRNLGLPEDEVASRAEEALSLVGLSGMRKQSSLKLSYGQRKRLSLAGALAMRPEVLVMDEPTAGLDPQMASELMELAEQLHHSGTTVVISTHDVDLAYSWADVDPRGSVSQDREPDGGEGDRPSLRSPVRDPGFGRCGSGRERLADRGVRIRRRVRCWREEVRRREQPEGGLLLRCLRILHRTLPRGRGLPSAGRGRIR